MSQTDAEERMLSGTSESEEQINELQLVPVSESIRYRKRAQTAEKKNLFFAEELAQMKTETAKLSEQLSELRSERELVRKLSSAGAKDLEAAVLVAKARMSDSKAADPDEVIGQLRKEKAYLFSGGESEAVTFRKTSGVRDSVTNAEATLAKAAKKASVTGNRVDLQEYLKLRRNFV
jgi:hypothetical protein